MICLTGDVHQEYDSEEQECYSGTEFEAALEYLDIAQSYNIATTLFLTGKVAKVNSADVVALGKEKDVEIGGHTWNAFYPQWLHLKVFQRFFGSVYGPKWYQNRDINRTLRILEEQLGNPVQSWRTHAYNSDDSTYELLSNTSIKYISDEKSPAKLQAYKYEKYDLTEYPINVLTDHEHLIHGSRTEESVQQLQDRGWSDAFGSESFTVKEWKERVIEQIDAIEREDGTATLLIHPGCMKATDDFGAFEEICRHIADEGYETRTMRAAK